METTTVQPGSDHDFEEHLRTYRGFARGVAICAALALLTLATLAWYFIE